MKKVTDHRLYAGAASDIFHQLSELVTAEDKEKMVEFWNRMKFSGVWRWTLQEQDRVQQLISAPHPRRAALLKTFQKDRAEVLLAALFFVRAASSVFRAISDNFLDSPGPYKAGVCRAGAAWLEIISKTMTFPLDR